MQVKKISSINFSGGEFKFVKYTKSELARLELERNRRINSIFFNLKGDEFLHQNDYQINLLKEIRRAVYKNDFYSKFFGNIEINKYNLPLASNFVKDRRTLFNNSVVKNIESLMKSTINFDISNARNMVLNKVLENKEFLNEPFVKNSLGDILYYTDRESKALGRINVLNNYLTLLKSGKGEIPLAEDLIIYTNSLPASDVAITIMNNPVLYSKDYIKKNLGDILECADNQIQAKVLNCIFSNPEKFETFGLKRVLKNSINMAEQEPKLYEGDIYMAKVSDLTDSIIEHINTNKYELNLPMLLNQK